MGSTHIRVPKNFVLEERLERFGDLIEQRPEKLIGRWAKACWPIGDKICTGAFDRVHLDLGCGKGAGIVELARRSRETLFIGMDTEPICIAYAAQHATESGLRNIVIVPRGAESIDALFAPGELSRIELNFPTPHPKRRHAHLRLTNVDHLISYRRSLGPNGLIALRTDSLPLRDYSLLQLDCAGYELVWISDDAASERSDFARTEYESRLIERGAPVYGICARPGRAARSERIEAARRLEQSLVGYLPSDLSSLGYVPLGMEATVRNLLGERRNLSR
ncbi:tRNA (guanine-N(7)-)-methyltransferase [Coriobacterium glomerans PW2]|uniref:tRNA (guanine(46)-N(7))-methyltransferase n=1 Tax=Coriobacterium glomerans (strain ATCC 49209 / DSM 20642 / JCM 10262 / PW2) TaxID=700015 RepID=F2NBH2_CORGP|nr:methyltransferase domain-containing protein [Coriobacterium glomerans]AEB06708.1 tRNA (guanine-N(7)-)-methyltransferase [Coriobacterium glomerans PW2]